MKMVDTWCFMGYTFLKFEKSPPYWDGMIKVDGVEYNASCVYDAPNCISVKGEYDFKDKDIIFDR